MEVVPGTERLHQRLIAGKISHDTQFDLAVVGGEQALVAIPDNEPAPDPAAFLGPDGDVLQVGIGRRQAAGGRDRLVVGGVDPPVLVGHRDQRVHDALEFGDVPVPQQMCEYRVAGLGQQSGERLGIGGVPRLDPFGLGQAELGEQDLLQLFGRAQVELVPDQRVRALLGRFHLPAQRRRHGGEVVAVGRYASPLHPGEDVHQRQLNVVQQPGSAAALQVGVERGGQLSGGRRLPDQRGRHRYRRLVVVLLTGEVERELAGRLLTTASQLLAQVTQDQVGQVERALAGQGEIRGKRGVAGHPGQVQASCGQRVHRALGVVQRLRPLRVGEPGGQRRLILLGQGHRVEVGTGTVGGCHGKSGQLARATSPASPRGQAGPLGARGVLLQPLRHLVGAEPGDLHVKAGLGRPLGSLAAHGRRARDAVRQRRIEPVPEHPELERIEQLMDLLPVPGGGPQVQRAGLQRDIAGKLGELPVAQYVAEVLAELVPRLALDLVHPIDELRQRAEVSDPLGGGLLPHPGNVRQVVAGVAANRGEVRILGGGEAVLGGDLVRGEAGHLTDAAPGHQRGDVRVDQLEHITVTGDDEHVHAFADRLAGQRGNDVVRLVTRHRQPGDAQRVEHLEDQAELAAEVGGCFLPVGLVLDVLLVPERRLAPVERDRHVRGLLVPQHVDEHGGEPVDSVGRLPGRGREVLRGQREEGPVGERVPIQQQKPPV